MVLQPLFTGRWYALRRAQTIRAIERSHGSRVITMIYRQEKTQHFPQSRDSKSIDSVFDLTVVLADMGEKALAQVKTSFSQLRKNPGRTGRGQKFEYVGFISRANAEFADRVCQCRFNFPHLCR